MVIQDSDETSELALVLECLNFVVTWERSSTGDLG